MSGADTGKRTWRQRLLRLWWSLRARLGWPIPREELGGLVELYKQGKEEEMMERFHELGGTVEKMEGACPPWSIDGDVWNEETGEIWNVEPCFQGGKSIYVGNMFKDPVIRGKENPYRYKNKEKL